MMSGTNWDRIKEKLDILSDAAKYDVSCSSSGSKRKNNGTGLGNTTGMGICHSYTEDGRCISLLKILLTNHCIFDCAYCVSRRSNDIKRAGFTVREVVDLTIGFYRRNYIEGLFLSSGIFKSPDATMERLVRVAKELRTNHKFNGYIHLKTIPGASEELIKMAGRYADRLSVNIELPTEKSLVSLAPEKTFAAIKKPMAFLKEEITGAKEEKALIRSAPSFAPGGQSSQMVIGATPESDHVILSTANDLYKNYGLKRVFYSGYVPIRNDVHLLPAIQATVPVLREHRLYQADWLMRFYKFQQEEIVNETVPDLDADIDPKLSWALRNPHLFPVDINLVDYEMILRIPGIGLKSAGKILQARRFGKLTAEQLKKMGIAWNRAKYFIICKGDKTGFLSLAPSLIRDRIVHGSVSKFLPQISPQLNLF